MAVNERSRVHSGRSEVVPASVFAMSTAASTAEVNENILRVFTVNELMICEGHQQPSSSPHPSKSSAQKKNKPQHKKGTRKDERGEQSRAVPVEKSFSARAYAPRYVVPDL